LLTDPSGPSPATRPASAHGSTLHPLPFSESDVADLLDRDPQTPSIGPHAGRRRRIVLAALSAAAFVSFWLVIWPDVLWAVPLWVTLAVGGVLWAWPGLPSVLPTGAATVTPIAARGAVSAEAALCDPHTGLFRRPTFLMIAERDWMRAGRYGGAVALLLIEVDRLRAMTERSGPAIADALLSGLGRQVMGTLRAADLLARFDDAQLAVFLPQADATGALDVAERIRAGVEHLTLPGLPAGAPLSASIGVSVLQPRHQPMSVLVADAQQALQAARHAGGNCVRIAPAGALPARSLPGTWARGGIARPHGGAES
jgi:diguanylate cyclase (GGDEF)-like protein